MAATGPEGEARPGKHLGTGSLCGRGGPHRPPRRGCQPLCGAPSRLGPLRSVQTQLCFNTWKWVVLLPKRGPPGCSSGWGGGDGGIGVGLQDARATGRNRRSLWWAWPAWPERGPVMLMDWPETSRPPVRTWRGHRAVKRAAPSMVNGIVHTVLGRGSAQGLSPTATSVCSCCQSFCPASAFLPPAPAAHQVSLDSCVASLRPPCPQPVCCQLQPGSVERRQRMSRPLLDPVRSSWGRVGAALGPAHLSASPRQGPSLLPLGMVLPCVEASAHGCRCCRQAHWAGTGYGATGIPP